MNTPFEGRELLLQVRDRNRAGFELLTAALDASIQLVYAQASTRFPPSELHGAVLAANVRNNVGWYGGRPEMKASTLTLSRGRNCSVAIVDAWGQDIRLRKHPRKAHSGMLAGIRSATVPTLFGDGPEPEIWELAALWHPDPGTQALGAAWLGAVQVAVEPIVILDRVSLPVGSPALFAVAEHEERPEVVWEPGDEDALEQREDDFDDYFDGGEALPGS